MTIKKKEKYWRVCIVARSSDCARNLDDQSIVAIFDQSWQFSGKIVCVPPRMIDGPSERPLTAIMESGAIMQIKTVYIELASRTEAISMCFIARK